MANNINRHLSHIKSSQTQTVTEYGLEVTKPKLPLASQIMDGEIAINFADGHETISIHNNASPSEVVSFLNENVIYESEEITAAALVDLDGRLLVCEEQGESFANMVSITYSELKTLRNSASLVPGRWYRITDYATTTTQTDTQAASNPFDVVVLATDIDALSENARAVQREGTSYFDDANLNAWELKYSLDNDDDKFTWADTTNGKGVIYYMKDEWNNECPYDFKNIQFKRWAITNVTSTNLSDSAIATLTSRLVYNASTQPIRYSYRGDGNISNNGTVLTVDVSAQGSGFYYTFTWIDNSGNIQDASIVGQTLVDATSRITGVCGNKIGTLTVQTSGQTITQFSLNNNVFISSHADNTGRFGGMTFNAFDDCCYGNTVSSSCNQNVFGKKCANNILGQGCSNNVLGCECIGNIFGGTCISVVFENACVYNTMVECRYCNFNGACSSNTFGGSTGGDRCADNTLGAGCYRIVLSDGSSHNSFGNGCHDISLYDVPHTETVIEDVGGVPHETVNTIPMDAPHHRNTFGDGCHDITFGGNIIGVLDTTFGQNNHHITISTPAYGNIFGNNCSNIVLTDSSYNKFGNECSHITTTTLFDYNTIGNNCSYFEMGSRVKNNTFGNSCSNITLADDNISNTFGNDCAYIEFDKNYTQYVEVGSGNRNILLTTSATPTESLPLQNIIIRPGLNNIIDPEDDPDVPDFPLVIDHFNNDPDMPNYGIGDNFCTTYQKSGSNVIDI